jgi:hypothetical protein
VQARGAKVWVPVIFRLLRLEDARSFWMCRRYRPCLI